MTQEVSHRPIKYQSRLWSRRGTKVNGSHHGDIPLLRPTGIQIATKSYATLKPMAPTNVKTVHQTSLLHIESNLDRLGLLAYPRPAFSAINWTNWAPTSFDQQVQVSQGHTLYKNKEIEIPRSTAVEALSWWSRRASQHPAVQSPVHPCKKLTNLARSPLLVALVLIGRNKTVVRHQLFPQNLSVQACDSRAQGFSLPLARRRSSCPPPSPNLVRTHPTEHYQSLRDSAPCLSRAATLPKGTNLELGRGAHLGTSSSTNHTAAVSQPTG